MKGAGRRAAHARASGAEVAFVGNNANSRELQRYIDGQHGAERVALPPEALSGALRSSGSDLPVISRAEFLKQQRT